MTDNDLRWQRYLEENSFEFSTKGLDTADEDVVMPWPCSTLGSSQAEFLLNTLKRDGVEVHGPFRLPDERLIELRELLGRIGLLEEFDKDLRDVTEFLDVWPVYGIRSRVPQETLVELLRRAMTCDSPRYERAMALREEEARLENERNTAEARYYEETGLEPATPDSAWPRQPSAKS